MYKKTKTKKRVFSSLFISYIAVLILPIIVTCVISILSINLLLGQITQSSRASSEQARNILDSHIENAYFCTSILLTNSSVTSLKYRESFSPEDITTLQQLQRTINQVAAQNYLVSDYYIIFNKTQSVLSSKGLYYGEEFSFYTDKVFHMDYSTFTDTLLFESNRKALSVPYETATGIQNNSLFLYHKDTQTKKAKDSGVTIIAVINRDNLRSILESLSADSSFATYLIDENSTPVNLNLAENNQMDISSLHSTEESKSNIYTSLWLGKPIYSKIPSSVTNWSYYFILTADSFTRSVRVMIWIATIMIFIGLFGGIAFCYHMTQRQYSPLQILIDRLLYVIGNKSSSDSAKNEYELIEYSLNNLIKQKSVAENEAVKYKNTLAESNLRNLLMGHFKEDATLISMKEKYNYQFHSEQFAVLLYSVEGIDSTLMDKNDEAADSALDLIYSFISAVLTDYKLPEYTKYTTIVEDYIACLICPEQELSGTRLLTMANETAAYIRQRFDIDLLVGISNVNTGLRGIARSYFEASSVLEYSALLGLQNSIMHYNELPTAQETVSVSLISEMEHRYYNCIRACDFNNAAEIQNEIISLFFRENQCSAEQAKYRLYGLINITLSALEEIKPQIDDDFWNSLDLYNHLLTTVGVTGFIEYSNRIYQKLQDYFDSRQLQQSSDRDERLVAYVNDNYTNPNLNIAMLSDLFDMSPSYLSKTFKKTTGQGLLDYIHMLRINKAKELMQNTNESLKNIAEQVGYSNNLTMIRAFRRYEGVTPGAYKESL